MKLSVLTENCAGTKFGAEHGLSYLIEVAGKRLLFDTGILSCFFICLTFFCQAILGKDSSFVKSIGSSSFS